MGAVALTCLAGPGTAASWSSSAQVGAPVITAAAATPEISGFPALTHRFTGSTMSTTVPVQIRNTGDIAADLSTFVTVEAGASQELLNNITVTAWPVPSPAECTPNSTTAPLWTGRWNSVPTLTERLAPGATVTLCIRTTLDRRNLVNTVASLSPSLQATLAVPGTQWRSTVTATAIQSVSR